MHKRRRRTEMVALTIVILVSPNAKTKGGGPHVLLFDLCLSLRVEVQNVKASSQQSLLLCHAISHKIVRL